MMLLRRVCLSKSNNNKLYKSFSIQISASLVKELREKSGAPMMECKKALMDSEVQGDITKAMDWLRAKGIAKANSQTTRISAEGLIAIYQNNNNKNNITLVEVNSETDFVSRNQDFQKFVATIASSTNQRLGNGDFDANQILDLQTLESQTPTTIRHLLGDITTAIRESIIVRRGLNLSSLPGTLSGTYIHGKLPSDGLLNSNNASLEFGREAAIVTLTVDSASPLKDEVSEKIHQAAKRLAMHVVAAKPTYLKVEDVPQQVVDNETIIFREQTLAAPPKNLAMIDKIISSKVVKRLQEISLNGQTHMAVEGAPVIEKYLQGLSRDYSQINGSNITISLSSFTHWTLGQTLKQS